MAKDKENNGKGGTRNLSTLSGELEKFGFKDGSDKKSVPEHKIIVTAENAEDQQPSMSEGEFDIAQALKEAAEELEETNRQRSNEFQSLGAAAKIDEKELINPEWKNKAFEEIKEKLKSRLEQFLEDNPRLEGKVDPEKFLNDIANKMLRNDDGAYDIFENLSGKKQEGVASSFIEKEKFGKLIGRFFYIAEKMKKDILAGTEKTKEPKDKVKKPEAVASGEPEDANKKTEDPKTGAVKVEENTEKLEKYEEPGVPEKKEEKETLPKEETEKVEEKPINPREKELSDNLADVRNRLADTEYRQRSMLQTIEKYFNNKFAKEKDKYETPDIRSYREEYERALKEYKNYQIENLKDKNLSEKELEKEVKKTYSFYNLDEVTKYYDARIQAKMGYLAEKEGKSSAKKTWDYVRLKSAQISEWYNKEVPLVAKIALAAAAFVPGASAIVLGKRTWGAFMMLAAGGMQIDKIAQLNDMALDRLRRADAYDEVANGFEKKVDFDKLSELLDGEIDNIDKKINDRNFRSGVNKFVAFAGAAFLGATTFKGIMDLASGHAGISNGILGSQKTEASVPNANLAGAEFPTPPSTGMFADVANTHNNAPSINTLDSSQYVTPKTNYDDVTKLKEAARLNIPPHTENLIIKEGSSIERTLIDNIKTNHPEIKNPGAAAHRMWLDYMHDNRDEIIKKVGDSEYNKMLKDGMVNVKAGTGLNLVMDKNGLSLRDIDGKISHIEHAAPSLVGGVNDMADVSLQQDLAKELTASSADIKAEAENLKNYEKNLGGANDAINRTSEMVAADREMVQSRLRNLFEKANILDSPNTKTAVLNIKTSIFGKSAKAFLALKGEHLDEIMKSDEAKEAFLKKIPRVSGRNLFNEFIKQFPPKSGDTTLKWMVRIAVESKK